MSQGIISENLQKIKGSIPEGVNLVLVSKRQTNEAILEAYEAGQSVFGENRVQELELKYASLPKDIEWHLIGHLQRNKVKYIAPFVSLIHSVDTRKLLHTINEQAEKYGRVIPCLLQVYVADESTKFGFSEEELLALYEDSIIQAYKSVRICGVMGMATFTDDQAQVRSEFKRIRSIFDLLKAHFHREDPCFNTVSMGMSGDYTLAIEEGSTMVRIGSSVFGSKH